MISVSHTSLTVGIALLLPFTAAWGVWPPAHGAGATYAVLVVLLIAIGIIVLNTWKSSRDARSVAPVTAAPSRRAVRQRMNRESQ